MADAYVVELALVAYYTVPNEANRLLYIEAAEVGMDQRFNLPTRRLWSRLVYQGALTQAQLAGELNKVLETPAMLAVIAPDFSTTPDKISGVVGVALSSWTPGGGGAHEGVSTVQAVVNGGAAADWMFSVAPVHPPMPVTVRCSCRWVRRPILP